MAADLRIPVYTSLDEVYPDDFELAVKQGARFNELAEEFEACFGRKPAFIARAPGRVNLIGEHIDYALFGVFPAAVEQDILMACAPRPIQETSNPSDPHHLPGSVKAHNLHPKYTPQSFAPMLRPISQKKKEEEAKEEEEAVEAVHVHAWHMDIDTTQLRWESYVKAGYYGVLNHFFHPTTLTSDASAHPTPVDILATGRVPAGSGLSSSAAMVVASTLSFLAVNDKLTDPALALTKGKLVEMAVENEKRVGVNSGGMDQAASILSTLNSALYITFYPSLHAELISLPTHGAVFVCANSLVVSDKVVGAKTRYNLRVVETLVAARVLGRELDLNLPERSPSGKPITLREVLSAYMGVDERALGGVETEALKEGLEKILEKVERLKVSNNGPTQDGVTMEQMVEMSGLSKEEFTELFLSWVDVEATYFQLYKRTKHIFSEALRVLQFREHCLEAETRPDGENVDTLKALGALMDASQTSCSQLYECSCPELDELTQISRECGAYGSRLTGAGWGGCTVSIVPESDVEGFIARVKSRYAPYKNLEGDQLKEVIFATKPGMGAFVFQLKD